MLGLVTGPAREGATSARRENIDPINLVQSIMNEFPTIGIDEICRRVDAVLVLAANLAPWLLAPVEPEAPAKIAGDIPLHRDPVELKLGVDLAKTFGASHRHR